MYVEFAVISMESFLRLTNLYEVDTSRRSKNQIINMLKMKYAADI